MTQTDEAPRIGRPAYMGARSRAFRVANRHSRRVQLLKRSIIAVCTLGIAGLIGVTLFDPFSKLPEGLSVGQTTLDGTRITMELPKLSGFRKDGRPYEVRAASGVQDVRTPKVIELKDIEARVGLGDNDSASASAPKGIFDSGRDFLQLRSTTGADSVRIVSTSGYAITLKNADFDFRSGEVNSDDPVAVRLPNGALSADRFSMSDQGRVVKFEGHVVSRLWQDTADLRPGETME
jgi:lipopolysaccharide export system protein LptC